MKRAVIAAVFVGQHCIAADPSTTAAAAATDKPGSEAASTSAGGSAGSAEGNGIFTSSSPQDFAATCEDGFVSAGGIQVDAGGVVVNSGGLHVRSGGMAVNSGGLNVQDGGAVYQSTAGFALQVIGKSAIRSTAENAAALSVRSTSHHFEATLLDLHTDSRVSVSGSPRRQTNGWLGMHKCDCVSPGTPLA